MDRETLNIVKQFIEKDSDNFKYYNDYFELNMTDQAEDRKESLSNNIWLRNLISKKFAETKNAELAIQLYGLLKNTYLYAAPHKFEDFMIYIEWERKPEERFYLPRRKALKKIVDFLQMLEDDELDELFVSCPPRIGKTTLMMFFKLWVIARHPERSNLYCAFSDGITSKFYSGLLEVLTDNYTYAFGDVFPDAKVVATNAKEESIDIGRKKRYCSFVSRSLYGSLNGAVDASGYIIADDLIGGIEEALNKDRLDAAWSKVENNMLTRRKSCCKVLWIGTRWSLYDPIGRRIELLTNDIKFKDHRYMIVNMPALNCDGESNFDYDYGVGFTTLDYEKTYASFCKNNDEASWEAQYMCSPIERKGVLFEQEDIRYYTELPDAEPIRKFAAVDPAFGGGDFCSMSVGYQYEDAIYLVDVVFSNADKRVTQPEIAHKIIEWNLSAVCFEATQMTMSYKEGVEDLLKEEKYRCNVMTKVAPIKQAKEIRIFDKAPQIREIMFLDKSLQSKQYAQFMNNMLSFTMNKSANKHDDAPDSLAMLIDMTERTVSNMRIGRRKF